VAARCDSNCSETAEHFRMQSNTIYFGLNRAHKLTGTDGCTFSGIPLFFAALLLSEVCEDPDSGRRKSRARAVR
jgi:hypothetical protein